MMAILGGSSVTTLEGVLPFLIFSSGITWLPITLIGAGFGREREAAGPLSLLLSDRTTSFSGKQRQPTPLGETPVWVGCTSWAKKALNNCLQ